MEKRANPSLFFPPLVGVVLFFISGIVLSYFVEISFLIFSLLASAVLLFLLIFDKKGLNSVLIFVLSFFCGALHFENTRVISKYSLSYYLQSEPIQTWLKIKVNSSVNRYKWGYKKRFDFWAKVIAVKEENKWLPVSGKVKVYLFGEEPGFAYGDILFCQGSLLKVKNTSSFDKFSLILWVKPDTLKIVKESRHIFRFFFRLKEHLSNKIEKNLPYPHQAILSALILGERQKLPSLIKDSFMRTGTVHILSISGLHVGMMVYIFYLFLKLLRFPRQISLFLLILFIIPYVILTGAKAPIVRAGIMSGVYLSGLILRREGNILNSLAIACWLILIFDPYQLFNAGFQLSFLGVLSIVLFTPLIENYFLREKEERVIFKKAHIKRYLFRLFAVSLSAWLGSSGLIGYYFKIINPIAILANIIVIPLSFFVLATGIIFLFSFSLFTSPLSTTNLLTIEILLKSVTFLSKIPGGTVSVTNFSFPLVILYYLCLGIITLVIKVRRKR